MKEFCKQIEKTETMEVDGVLINKKLFICSNNRTCKKCEKYSFNKADDLYLNKYEVCKKCYILYIEGREEKWELEDKK